MLSACARSLYDRDSNWESRIAVTVTVTYRARAKTGDWHGESLSSRPRDEPSERESRLSESA